MYIYKPYIYIYVQSFKHLQSNDTSSVRFSFFSLSFTVNLKLFPLYLI